MPQRVSKTEEKIPTSLKVYALLAFNAVKRCFCSINRVQMEMHGSRCMNGVRDSVGGGNQSESGGPGIRKRRKIKKMDS